MQTVIDTLGDYEAYMKYERRKKKESIRVARLSLRYFTELYGDTLTTDLQPDDMYAFYEHLKGRIKQKKNGEGRYTVFDDQFVYKTMANIKTYVKWLKEKGLLTTLSPADVPAFKPPRRVPEFLEKEELAKILDYLEWNVKFANAKGLKRDIDAAYMRRAAVWFLYTTALRNFEFRSVKLTDVNMQGMFGNLIGKGGKLRTYTFNETAREKLTEYLQVRARLFPERRCRYLFFSGINDKGKGLSEYGLNKVLKKIAKRAGVEKNLHAHIFRHSLATHLLQDGRSIVAVRDKLGHENIATTSIYSHTTPKTLVEMTQHIGADLLVAS